MKLGHRCKGHQGRGGQVGWQSVLIKLPVYYDNSVGDISLKLYSVLSPVYEARRWLVRGSIHHMIMTAACVALLLPGTEKWSPAPLLRQPGIWIQARAMNRASNEPSQCIHLVESAFYCFQTFTIKTLLLRHGK